VHVTGSDIAITDVDTQALSGHRISRATVGTSAVQLVGAALADRRGVSVKALHSNIGLVYLGHDDTVTASTGYPLKKGESYNADLSGSAAIWAISDTAAQGVAIAEVGG